MPDSTVSAERFEFDRRALNNELEAAGADLSNKDEILRSVLAGCGDCIKILDLDGRLQFMSEGGKRVMEVEDFGALKGCPWPDFWEGQGNIDAHTAIASAKAGRTANFKGAANTAKGTPRYWDVTVSPIVGTNGRPYQILSISRDITVQHELEERQRILSGELVHRIKNTLAVAIGIARQTLRGIDPKAERDAFTSRLLALSSAQDLLIQSSSTSASIMMVIEGALVPFSSAGRITLRGPDLELDSKQALSLAIAVHELATNAVKYGALSNDTGAVGVDWNFNGDEFSFAWRELQGPNVAEPTTKGFGSRVIQNLLASDFGGTIVLTYESTGFVCRLTTARENLAAPAVR